MPNVKNDSSLYQHQNKKHSQKNVGSVENLKKKSEDDKNRNSFGYKPPLHGKNRGFAAQMLKNRNKYFTKNAKNNINVNKSVTRDVENTPKYGTSSTAEVRSSHK